MAIHLVHLTLALADRSLSTEATKWTIQRSFADIFLDKVELQCNGASRFNGKPCLDAF